MRSSFRTPAIMIAFLGIVSASGAQALAAGPSPAPTGRIERKDGKAKATPARKPRVEPTSDKTRGPAVPAPPAAAARTSPAPSAGPRVEARRGRGHF
jgi:hypothetical protein